MSSQKIPDAVRRVFLEAFTVGDIAEPLRNNLAHAQEIVLSDWDTIVMLGEFGMQQFNPTAC